MVSLSGLAPGPWTNSHWAKEEEMGGRVCRPRGCWVGSAGVGAGLLSELSGK